jgi:hypothetical protein
MSKEKYYQLMYDWNSDNDDTVFCNKEEIYFDDEYIVTSGLKLEAFNKRTSFYFDKGNIFEDYLDNVLTWPLVSEKFKMAFEKLNIDGVQFFPVSIQEINNIDNVKIYWLLNIINFPDCLDLKQSKYRELHKESGMVLGLTHPVLIKEKLKGMHILRAQKDVVSIYISEILKNEIEYSKISGVDFREVKVV